MDKKIIVYPPTVRFDRLAQAPRHMLQELSKRGFTCYFCDIAQVRGKSLRKISDNLFVCYDINALAEELKDREIIFYNTWPDRWNLKKLFKVSFSIFHYLDDFKEWDKNLDNACKDTDLILAVSDKLFKKLESKYRDKLYKFNNACDFPLFHQSIKKETNNKRPLIYYHGCLHINWVDIELIKKLLSSLPDFDFIFVGDNFNGSEKFKNCKIIEHKDITELPELLSSADCCIIPFLQNDISASSDPLKVYEFLSQGKPVISSPIPELLKYKVIDFAEGAEEFVSAIKKAMKTDTFEKKVERIRIAIENSWEKRIDYLLPLLEDRKKEENDLISIVLPVYNQDHYLPAAIEGVLNQTYRNIELIIVNDGSTDNTKEVIEEYRKKDHRIRVIHQENKKLPAALNAGFKIARGQYLTWTSSDNIQEPEQIKTLLDYLKKNLDKGMVYSDYRIIDDKGKFLYGSNFRTWNQSKEDTSVIKLPREVTINNFHNTDDNFIGASFLYRKEIAEKVGEYNEKFFGAEDLDYWLRIHQITEFGHVDKLLYRYRVHAMSLGSRYKEFKILETNNLVRNEDKKRRGKINVAIQLPHFGTGGMEQTTNNIICGLDKDKFNVTMIITDKSAGNVPPDIERNKIEVYVLNNNLKTLEGLIKEKKFSIVNFHHSLFGLDLYKKYRVKTLYTIHNIYSWVNPSPEYHKIDKFIAVSNSAKEYFSYRFNVSHDRILTIPNGLDTQNIQGNIIKRERFDLNSKDFIFINIANITKVKMQHLQILAMADLVKDFPRFKLLFVGSVLEPTYYKTLQDMIRKKNLSDHVKILLNKSRSEVASLLHAADCFLLPSIVEGWSNAMMEAMYCCKPLILSDVGAARDVIKNNDIGVIIKNPYGDIKNLTPEIYYKYCHGHHCDNLFDLKNAMVYIYNERKYFSSQAKIGMQKILNSYTVSHMVSNYERELENAKFTRV